LHGWAHSEWDAHTANLENQLREQRANAMGLQQQISSK
jgi:hypothetical protein